MGDTGAKKGLYSQRLSKLLQVPYISMGSLVSRCLSLAPSLYKQEILDQFADIDLVLNFKCTEEDLARKNLGIIDLVLNFKCTEEDLARKNLGIMTMTQSIESTLLDKGGSSNSVAPGADVGGHWKEKYSLYIQQNKMLEDYDHEQKKLLNFQVASAPAEIWRGLLAALHLQRLNAIRASKKTTPRFNAI